MKPKARPPSKCLSKNVFKNEIYEKISNIDTRVDSRRREKQVN
jgi:hypothetical protein